MYKEIFLLKLIPHTPSHTQLEDDDSYYCYYSLFIEKNSLIHGSSFLNGKGASSTIFSFRVPPSIGRVSVFSSSSFKKKEIYYKKRNVFPS